MTERQQQLLNHLLKWSGALQGRDVIQANLPHLYPSNGALNPYNDSAFSNITQDIQAINDDDECEYFIISQPKGIRIASTVEYKKAIENERRAILRRFVRLNKKIRKANKHLALQYDFTNEDFKVVESLINGIKESHNDDTL
jgi:hypothetical protein